MTIHTHKRRSGKTSAIIDQLKWCCVFNYLPVVVVCINRSLQYDMIRRIHEVGLTTEEFMCIHVLDALSKERLFVTIRSLNPRIIFIDEVFNIKDDTFDMLNSMHESHIIAYGTPLRQQHS